jgi:hypothetical protein
MHRLDIRETASEESLRSEAFKYKLTVYTLTDYPHKRVCISEASLESHAADDGQEPEKEQHIYTLSKKHRPGVFSTFGSFPCSFRSHNNNMSQNGSAYIGKGDSSTSSNGASHRLESGGASRVNKAPSWNAAAHIGSVEDAWPMYSAQASDYILGPSIGFGASSVVYQASFTPLNGRACAVKVIDLEAFGSDLGELRRETQLMSLSKHPNVLRVRGCWVDGSKLHIATRLMSSGSILDIMRFSFPEGFEEVVIATVLKQALEGLRYLHLNNWLHR